MACRYIITNPHAPIQLAQVDSAVPQLWWEKCTTISSIVTTISNTHHVQWETINVLVLPDKRGVSTPDSSKNIFTHLLLWLSVWLPLYQPSILTMNHRSRRDNLPFNILDIFGVASRIFAIVDLLLSTCENHFDVTCCQLVLCVSSPTPGQSTVN